MSPGHDERQTQEVNEIDLNILSGPSYWLYTQYTPCQERNRPGLVTKLISEFLQ